jgi:hypothetical protein
MHHSRIAAASSRAASGAIGHRKKPYKIVLESVTEEKKKLRSTVRLCHTNFVGVHYSFFT